MKTQHSSSRRSSLKKLAGIGVGLGLLEWGLFSKASAQYHIIYLASPANAGPYNAFSTLNTHIREFTDKLTIDVKETQGATFHVKYMLQNPQAYKNTVFSSGTVVSWAAAKGIAPFFPSPHKAARDFRIIVVLGRSYNVWVTMEKSIKTPEEFPGKRIGIGLLSQNEWGMHEKMLLDAWGLTPKLRSLDILGSGQNISALLDGREDVGTLFELISADGKYVVVTGPHRELEASPRAWQYVDVPAKKIEEYVNKTGAPFRVVHFSPNKLPKQPNPLTTFGDLLTISAHKSFPDQAAYDLAHMLAANYNTIAKYSAFTRAWTPQTLAYTAKEHPENFHPGAVKAFRDLGLI